MNILYINQPLCNRGDQSAQQALLKALLERVPDLRITALFVDTYSESSIKQFDIHDHRVKYISIHTSELYRSLKGLWLHNLTFLNIGFAARRIKNLYKKADWILCSPGGISMGGFQNWDHIYQLYLAKYYNRKLAYYGRSFGPFTEEDKSHRRFKRISYKLLYGFDYLSIRDKKTEAIADSMGLKYDSTVDCAFLETPNVKLPYEVRNIVESKPYMVFVPNLLIWHYAYKGNVTKQSILDFYKRIVKIMFDFKPECNIIMLPQTFDYNNENDDVNLFREIAEKVNDRRIVVLPDCYSSDIQQTIIKDCKLLIGARYHSVVFSLNQAVPFVALSYEHKIEGLLETLDKSDCMVDITGTFKDNDSINKTLYDISTKMRTAHPDIKARERAKSIASDCLDNFIQLLK